jgi:hypothetical protein
MALVFRYYASGNSGQALYDINNLQNLRMNNGNIEGFHNNWIAVVSELEEQPPETLLRHLYFEQIRHFRPLEADIAYYKRAQWNDGPEFCFQWFWDASCRYIKQIRADYMQQELNRGLNTRHNAAPAPKGKGKEKKGDERKPRSATPNRQPTGGGRGNPKGGTPRGRSADNGGKGTDTPTKGVCYAFQKGTCTRGAACSFSHVKGERSTSAAPRTQKNSTKQCTFFKSGTCKFGEGCQDLHGGNDRNASPKRKPKGKSKGDRKPAAAAAAISVLTESPASTLKVYAPAPVPGSVALAAASGWPPLPNCHSWLMDTGCKFDFTTRLQSHRANKAAYRKQPCPLPFRPPTIWSTVTGSSSNESVCYRKS